MLSIYTPSLAIKVQYVSPTSGKQEYDRTKGYKSLSETTAAKSCYDSAILSRHSFYNTLIGNFLLSSVTNVSKSLVPCGHHVVFGHQA